MSKTSGFLIKATTREAREYEKKNLKNLDLKFCSKNRFEHLNFEYKYEYEGRFYGFSKKDLDLLLEKYDNVFIIIRSIQVMRKLKRDYKQHSIIVVYVHSDQSKIEERMKKQDLSKDQIKYRLSRIEASYKDYVLNSAFFDEVIVNNSDKRSYYMRIDELIKKYSEK